MRGEYIYVKHPTDSYSRIGGLHSTYFDIAQKEYAKCLEIESMDISALNEFQVFDISDRMDQHKIKAIVFSALCVEAAINNYAGIHFGDKYSEKHLQSLDVISKWVIIPKLACGKSIDKSGSAFEALTRLIRSRNSLVHNKSKAFNSNPSFVDSLRVKELSFDQEFRNSLKALYLLCMEMDFVLGQKNNPIGTLDKNFAVCLEIPKQLEPLYNECKGIVLKQYPKEKS